MILSSFVRSLLVAGLGAVFALSPGRVSALGGGTIDAELVPDACPDYVAGETLTAGCYAMTVPYNPPGLYPTYQRSFLVLVPEGFEADAESATMVVDFHGFGASKEGQLQSSCWKKTARDRSLQGKSTLTVYPNGTGEPRSFRAGDFCCQGLVQPPRDDVQFTRDLVQKVKDSFPASLGWKVYASGLSNGGAMAHNLACELTDVIDGVAPVSQTFTKSDWTTCLTDEGEWHIPVFDNRATDDILIPYAGGYGALLGSNILWPWKSALESLTDWAHVHQCAFDEQDMPVVAELSRGNQSLALDAFSLGMKGYALTDGDPPESYCIEIAGCKTRLKQCTVVGLHVLYKDARTPYSVPVGENQDVCEHAMEFFEAAQAVPYAAP